MPDPRLAEALTLALELHADQRRKGTDIPYAAHLLAVTALVLEAGAGRDDLNPAEAALAAPLHDALEDQGHRIAAQDIARRFGPGVAKIVGECSDAVATAPGAAKPPWRTRKLAYLDTVPGKRRETQLVLAADKLHNLTQMAEDLRATGPALWARFNAGREDQLWLHGELIGGMRAGWPANPLLPRLERALAALAALG